MSRETRTIRPFVGVEALGRAFDRSLLHFGKETCPPGGNQVVEISPQEFLARQVTLSLAPDDESFEMFKEELRMAADEAGLPLEALSLLIVARSAFLGITDTVLNRSLDDLVDLQRRIDLVGSKRSPALRAPFGGFVVEAFLYLERPLEAQPLRPHRRGTWLAKARYGISTSLGPAVPPITPLTEETRARLRLPAKTIRYVDFGEHDVLEPIRDTVPPTYYIDEAILAQLTARKSSATSRAIQLQLALDFVSAVIWRAALRAADLDGLTFEDVRDSLLGQVLRLAAGPGASDGDRNRLLALLSTDPDRVAAYAEDVIAVGDGLTKALKDGDE